MPIVLPSGFQITSQEPIDSRITKANQAERLALSEFNVFPGLIVYQQDTQKLYVLNDTGSVGSNAGWSEISGSGGGSAYSAQFNITSIGSQDYLFNGDGFPSATADPELILVRGFEYAFVNDNAVGQHPIQIQTNAPSGGSGTPYSSGVTNNNAGGGSTLLFNVPFSAPDQLYYQCSSHPNMSGSIRILSADGGSGVGFPFSGSAIITGSLLVSQSFVDFTDAPLTASIISASSGITGSLLGTASTASYVETAQTASYVKNAQTASYVETAQTASYVLNAVSSSYALTASYALEALVEITKEVSSSYAESASLAESASFVPFDGNRVVTNQDQPTGIKNVNFGANGLTDFIEKVYFANTAPTITSTSYLNIPEFTPSGSLIGTINTSDAESQAVTVQTQSSYTADQFRIEGANQLYFNVDATESMNTDSSQGYDAAPLPVRATDTLGLFTDKTLYIQIIPNSPPTFRNSSIGGSIITGQTDNTNIPESSANGVKRTIYYADANGDTVTINTGSLSTEFETDFQININSGLQRIQIEQISNVDFDTYPTYTFVLTASDEHYPTQDPEAIRFLTCSISVVDNTPPNMSNQSIAGVNENINVNNGQGGSAGNYINAGQVVATGPEVGDTLTFTNATLKSLSVGGVNVPLASYGGTSQSDPTEDAFEMNATGYFTRKAGVFINSDLIDSYVYTVSVQDNYDPTVISADITIPIADDVAPAINDNWSGGPYINESALSGDSVVTNTNGVGGTQAQFTTTYNVTNETVSWQLNPATPFALDGSQRISANANISASYFSPSTIAFSVTASNTFGTENKQAYSVTVTDNQAPTISSRTPISLNAPQNANTNMCNITISDVENNTPYVLTLTGTDAALLNPVSQNGNGTSWQIQLANSEANGRSFSYNEVVTDSYGSTRTYARTLTLGNVQVKTYVYGWTGYTGNAAAAFPAVLGDNSGVITAGSLIDDLMSGSLGASSFTNTGGSTGTATLYHDQALTTLSDASNNGISTLGYTNFGSGNQRFLLIFPSSSAQAGKPADIFDGAPPASTPVANRYYVYLKDIAIPGSEPGDVYYFTTENPVDGNSDWGMVYLYSQNGANTRYYLMPDTQATP